MPRVTITVPGKKSQPYRFQADRQTTRLGRGSENDIIIDCPSVSVYHAELERVPGGFQLRDLDSTNGTKLDGERKRVIPLRDGMTVRLGDVDFEFQLTEEEKVIMAGEKPVDEFPVTPDEDADAPGDRDRGPARLPELEKEPARPHQPPRPRVEDLESARTPSAMASFGMTLLLFALAIGAFVAGMELAHRKLTKRSLIGEMASGPYTVEAAQPPAEEAAPAGTE